LVLRAQPLKKIKTIKKTIKMKKIVIILSLLVSSFWASAQGTIQLTLRWNISLSRYEVYAKPSFTQNNFPWGPSQISPVLPSSSPDANLVITSHNAGSWADNSKVYAPAAQSTSDFHGVESSGGPVNLVANTETLIFSFVFVDGTCRDGLRLFVNTSDPQSSASGMSGGDFRNSISNANLQDVYISNYENTGTTCNACNVTAPELSKN
jgi:hypothetical protein